MYKSTPRWSSHLLRQHIIVQEKEKESLLRLKYCWVERKDEMLPCIMMPRCIHKAGATIDSYRKSIISWDSQQVSFAQSNSQKKEEDEERDEEILIFWNNSRSICRENNRVMKKHEIKHNENKLLHVVLCSSLFYAFTQVREKKKPSMNK